MSRVKYSDKGNYDYTFGAVCVGPGMMRFRVWAPNVKQVCLEFSGQAPIPMTACEQGFHELTCACAPGARYRYRMDGALCVPDPASRLQDGDIHDASIVTDVDVYPWRNENWRGLPWSQTVLYEIHVGLAGDRKSTRLNSSH